MTVGGIYLFVSFDKQLCGTSHIDHRDCVHGNESGICRRHRRLFVGCL